MTGARCRPLSEEEQKANVQSVVSCNDMKREVTVLNSLFKQADRTFTFDKVKPPAISARVAYDVLNFACLYRQTVAVNRLWLVLKDQNLMHRKSIILIIT